MVSYLLDLVFYKIDYGSMVGIRHHPIEYMGYYMIMGFWLFPTTLMYNYIINYHMPINMFVRMLACIILLLIFCGTIDERFHFGYYIGKYRFLKNIIAIIVTGILVELLRNWVVSIRMGNRRRKPEMEEREFLL